ncbi:hypothetical protein LJC59_07140, partial [Desulfovibrio sp. OttesenSCG-928-A18]|nr:hypothetical protein [Desulfovibrio sp. OttesenSCG-928-A18]
MLLHEAPWSAFHDSSFSLLEQIHFEKVYLLCKDLSSNPCPEMLAGELCSPQFDDKPRCAGICKGTPTPALYGGSECRLRLRGGLLPKNTLSTASGEL